MSTSQSRGHVVDPGVLRRLVHLALLIGIVVGVRACGGATTAEDQLGAGTQWFAERTGLAAAKDKWDKSIRPPIAAMTDAASQSLYRGVARTLDSAEAAADDGAMWVGQLIAKAADSVTGVLRSIFVPGAGPAPQKPDSPRQAQPAAPPAR